MNTLANFEEIARIEVNAYGRMLFCGNTLVSVGRWENYCLTTYDTIDVRNPKKLAEIPFKKSLSHLTIRGNTLYVCEYRVGVHVIDLSDPSTPVLTNLIPFVSEEVSALSFINGFLVILNRDNGLWLIDPADHKKPSEATLPLNDGLDFTTDGSRLFDACGHNGLIEAEVIGNAIMQKSTINEGKDFYFNNVAIVGSYMMCEGRVKQDRDSEMYCMLVLEKEPPFKELWRGKSSLQSDTFDFCVVNGHSVIVNNAKVMLYGKSFPREPLFWMYRKKQPPFTYVELPFRVTEEIKKAYDDHMAYLEQFKDEDYDRRSEIEKTIEPQLITYEGNIEMLIKEHTFPPEEFYNYDAIYPHYYSASRDDLLVMQEEFDKQQWLVFYKINPESVLATK